MSNCSLPSPHKRRRIGLTLPSTSPPLIASSSNNVTIDLTQEDDDDHEVTRQSSKLADTVKSTTMNYEDDEALARALQEEYDQLDSEPPQTQHPTQSQSRLPKPAQDHSTWYGDEELARQLQAELDNENGDVDAGNSHPQQPLVDPDEAFARMLQEQEDSYDDTNNAAIPYPSPIHVPAPTTTNSDVVSGDGGMTSEFTQSTSEPSLQAREAEQAVCEFASQIAKLRCTNCGKNNLKAERDVLAVSQNFLSSASHSKVMTCPKCNKPDTQKDNITLIWTLLCGFDVKSKANKPDKKRKSVASTNALSTKSSALGSGTGYGGSRNYTNQRWRSASNSTQVAPPLNVPQDQDDIMTTQVFGILADLLPSYERESSFDLEPPMKTIQALFLCSSILERAAELLRNNSLEDVTTKRGLYSGLVRFVQALASHHATSPLVFGERVIRSAGAGVLKVSLRKEKLVSTDATETTKPLTKCMTDLAAQCSMMLRSNDSDPEDVQILQAIKQLHEFVEANVDSRPGKSHADGDIAWTKELAVSEVPDEYILSRHSLASKQPTGATIVPGRMKRIMQEIAGLQASLPEGIYFRYASSRPDISKFLIVGPKDSPYENGLFEFDMLCDANFPNSPPQVQFRTTGGGIVAFNPNLYSNGKVCLSLLGTWSGEPWQPNKSTLLQVLVSIQAMILCEKPWYNEPGRDAMPNDTQSKSYNQGLYHNTVQTAMIDWLERRRFGAVTHMANAGTVDQQDDLWDEIVRRHFKAKQDEIVGTVGKWLAEVSSTGATSNPQQGCYGAGISGPYASPLPYQAHVPSLGQPGGTYPGGYPGSTHLPPHLSSRITPSPNYLATGAPNAQASAFYGTGWRGQTLGGSSGAVSVTTTTPRTLVTPATSATAAVNLPGNDLLQKLKGAVGKLRKNASSSRGYGFGY